MEKEYKFIKKDDRFVFYKGQEKLKTPMGSDVITEYESIAERLVNDLNKFGEDASDPISLVAFHYAMIDFYLNMELGRNFIERSISIGLDRERDWTFNCPTANPDVLMTWYGTFGLFEKQSPKGKEWIKTLSSMQLCAVCVIGRALESVNIPYIITNIKDKKQLDHYSQFINKFYPYVGIKELKKYFENLLFYFKVESGNNNKCESNIKRGRVMHNFKDK